MATDEQRFAQDRQRLQLILGECVSTAEHLLALRLQARSSRLDTLVGDLRADTLDGQQIVMSWTFRVGSEDRKLELAVGHTGKRWHPVVTLVDHAGTSQAVTLADEDWTAFAQLRVAIIESLKRIKNA